MFCPRCGAQQPESARFCGRCGQTIARRAAPAAGRPPVAASELRGEPAPVVAEPPTAELRGQPAPTVAEPPTAELGEAPAAAPPAQWPPPPVRHAGVDRRWVGAGIAVVLVAAVVVALLVTGVLGSRGKVQPGTRHAAAAAPTAVAPTATSTPAPATATATATATPTATATATAVSATVKRTCGVNGSGDCRLSVRARPDSSTAELRKLKEGDTLKLSCQTRGESVHSSVLGASSTVWSKTARGGYVANVYVAGPGLEPQRITLPRC